MSIGGIISSKWSAGSYEDDDEDLENSFSTWWWNTKQKILEVPGLVVALFVKPDHDGIQNARDLVYQYGQAVKHIPSLLRRLAFKTRTWEDELHEVSVQSSVLYLSCHFSLTKASLVNAELIVSFSQPSFSAGDA